MIVEHCGHERQVMARDLSATAYSSVWLTFVEVIKVKRKSCAANESLFHLSNLITMLMNGCVVFNIVHLIRYADTREKKLDLQFISYNGHIDAEALNLPL